MATVDGFDEKEGIALLYHRLQYGFVTVTSRNDTLIGYVAILPTMLLFTLAVVLPVGWGIVASFYDIPLYGTQWTFTGTENHVSVLQSPGFQYSLGVSTGYAILTTAIQMVLGVGIALVINKHLMRGMAVIRTVILTPYMLPTVVIAELFAIMGTRAGLWNDLLLRMDLIAGPISFFNTWPYAFFGVVAASVWKFTLFVVLLVLARLQAIPSSHYEAAQLAGANAWQQFRDITYPKIKGVLLIVLLLRGAWMWMKFDVIWILTQGGPSNLLNVFTVYAYKVGFTQFELGRASAVTVIGFALLAGVGVVYFKVFKPTEGIGN